MAAALTGWKLNRINVGPPYRVQMAGPWQLPQVVDARGTVAVSRGGAVFCGIMNLSDDGPAFVPDHELAEALCAAANAGTLEQA